MIFIGESLWVMGAACCSPTNRLAAIWSFSCSWGSCCGGWAICRPGQCFVRAGSGARSFPSVWCCWSTPISVLLAWASISPYLSCCALLLAVRSFLVREGDHLAHRAGALCQRHSGRLPARWPAACAVGGGAGGVPAQCWQQRRHVFGAGSAAHSLARCAAGMGPSVQHPQLPGRCGGRASFRRYADHGRRAQPGRSVDHGCRAAAAAATGAP